MILIDGSEGEGGGQMLRSSLTLSILTGKPFKLVNIRAGRPKPGLAAQHLASVLAAAKLCRATYKGASLGSSVLVFEPGEVKAGKFEFKVGTAGAVGLVLQTIALPAALLGGAASEFTIAGGTHVAYAPCFDFLKTTWCSFLKLMGVDLDMELLKPGFYPRGGGAIRVIVHPSTGVVAKSFTGAVTFTAATVRSITADLPAHVCESGSARMVSVLNAAGVETVVAHDRWDNGPSAVAIVEHRQGRVPLTFVAYGSKGVPMMEVGGDAAAQAVAWGRSGAAVDPYSGDQILLPLALAKQESTFTVSEVTQHLLTHRDIISRFLTTTIRIEGELGAPGRVSVIPEVECQA